VLIQPSHRLMKALFEANRAAYRPQAVTRMAVALSLTMGLLGSWVAPMWACAQCLEQSAPNSVAEEPVSQLANSHGVSGEEMIHEDGIHEFLLPNGHHLWVKQTRTAPIVTIDTWVATGSANETDANNGVSHFLEHLLFKGTPTHPAGSLDRILESKGSHFNAATSDDFTHFYITTNNAFFDEALKLHADMLLNASIPPSELDQERKVVIEEINRADDNPDRMLFMKVNEILFKGHGYGRDTLGPRENIANIPRQAILDYYHFWYRPEHFHTVVVGNVDINAVRQSVYDVFSQATPPPIAADKAAQFVEAAKLDHGPIAPPTGPTGLVLEKPDLNQSYLMVAFQGPPVSQFQDMAALDVAMNALGQGRSSRLYQVLRQRNPVVTDISAANMTLKDGGLVYVYAEMQPDKMAAAKAALQTELVNLKQNGITADELAKAKTQAVKSFVFHHESTDDMAGGIGQSVVDGKLSDYTGYVHAVEQVSLDNVKQMLNRYINWEQGVVAELVAPGSVDVAKGQAANQQWLLACQALESKSATTMATQTTAAKRVNSKSTTPSDAQASHPLAVQKVVLPNGLTLLTQPNPEAETVAIQLMAKGGQLSEPIPGVASLTASMMNQGTQARDAEAWSKLLESQGIQVAFSAQNDYLQGTGYGVASDLPAVLMLMREALESPRFDAEELVKKKTQLAQGIAASQDSPSTVAFETLSMALYPTHPYGNVGKRVLPHLDLITRDDILSYYQANVMPSRMVVAVTGKFDPAFVTQTLGSWFATPRLGEISSVAAKPAGALVRKAPPLKAAATAENPNLFEVNKAHLAATWIAQGWLAPTITGQDYIPLKVLNALLGSGMSSRLFVDLREKQGLAYTVGSLFPSQLDPSRFVMYLGTDPVNRAKVLAGFQQEITRLKTQKVSPLELQQAKDKLAGAFALDHETTTNQAYYLALYELLGVGYGFDQAYPRQVQSVTPDDIQRVAKVIFAEPPKTAVVAPLIESSDKTPPANPTGAAPASSTNSPCIASPTAAAATATK
jgi:zinc protease